MAQPVVRTATNAAVRQLGSAAEGERNEVVDLQPIAGAAAPAAVGSWRQSRAAACEVRPSSVWGWRFAAEVVGPPLFGAADGDVLSCSAHEWRFAGEVVGTPPLGAATTELLSCSTSEARFAAESVRPPPSRTARR